jgi:ribonuclease Z
VLKIIFIGTGSGKTSLKRFHSSILINTKEYNLLVDAGDGISSALLKNKIPFNKIDGILLTHFHPDHYTGIASLIVQMKMVDRKNELTVFVHHDQLKYLKDFILHSYLFNENMGFRIGYKTFSEKRPVKVGEKITFKVKQNSHLDEYKKFNKIYQLGLSCSSVLLQINKKNILYSGDIGDANDLLLFRKNKIDILITESSHIVFDDMVSVLRKLNPEKVYFTHIGDEREKDLEKFIRNTKSTFNAPSFVITAAFDSQLVNIE